MVRAHWVCDLYIVFTLYFWCCKLYSWKFCFNSWWKCLLSESYCWHRFIWPDFFFFSISAAKLQLFPFILTTCLCWNRFFRLSSLGFCTERILWGFLCRVRHMLQQSQGLWGGFISTGEISIFNFQILACLFSSPVWRFLHLCSVKFFKTFVGFFLNFRPIVKCF